MKKGDYVFLRNTKLAGGKKVRIGETASLSEDEAKFFVSRDLAVSSSDERAKKLVDAAKVQDVQKRGAATPAKAVSK